MPSFREIKGKVEEICADLNGEGAELQSNVTYNNGVKIVITGRNLIGKEVSHPLSCGHFHTQPETLNDEPFWHGVYDAVETFLRGLPLSLEQARFMPDIGSLVEALLQDLGEQVEIGIGIFIVTMNSVDDPDLPPEVREILKQARRRANYRNN